MARTYKSTYWYHIGSNWYYRWDSRGKKVKSQLSNDEQYRRNRIISSRKRKPKKPKAPPKRKPFDQSVFQNERPEKRVTVRIYLLNEDTEKWELLDKYDVMPINYYKRFLWFFNMYYDEMLRGDMEYVQTKG